MTQDTHLPMTAETRTRLIAAPQAAPIKGTSWAATFFENRTRRSWVLLQV
jgi:hypothetical protein